PRDQLSCRASSFVDKTGGANGRRRHERHDSELDGRRGERAAAARFRHLRQRLRTPAKLWTARWRTGRAVRQRLHPQRRSHQEPRLHAAQKDSRRGHGLIERLYGSRPRYNYFIGTSQGGREALTVAQRYPADYDGVAANVPIVSFSSLMLEPELIRIQEKPLANWVTPAKTEAMRAEFVRQCDKLDGLADGIINTYIACRAIFDISQGTSDRNPWAAKRCPDNVDPNPQDTSAAACFTDGQISTLKLVYSRYKFATPLAHGSKTFGMWVPTTDPSGSGLIATVRFNRQEGAAPDAQNHSHLGVLGVTGFLMKGTSANPLDYVEGGRWNPRREELSQWLDSTNPDLSAFARRGGKMIVAIGTNDSLASPGAQLDYYQSVLDKMGRASVDEFARFYVIPQTGHGLTGSSYTMNGDGRAIPATQIPSRFDRISMLL